MEIRIKAHNGDRAANLASISERMEILMQMLPLPGTTIGGIAIRESIKLELNGLAQQKFPPHLPRIKRGVFYARSASQLWYAPRKQFHANYGTTIEAQRTGSTYTLTIVAL